MDANWKTTAIKFVDQKDVFLIIRVEYIIKGSQLSVIIFEDNEEKRATLSSTRIGFGGRLTTSRLREKVLPYITEDNARNFVTAINIQLGFAGYELTETQRTSSRGKQLIFIRNTLNESFSPIPYTDDAFSDDVTPVEGYRGIK